MSHAPAHERNPEMRDQKHNEKDRVDVLVEPTDRAQDHDPLVADDQHHDGRGDVETYRVHGRRGPPAKRYCPYKNIKR